MGWKDCRKTPSRLSSQGRPDNRSGLSFQRCDAHLGRRIQRLYRQRLVRRQDHCLSAEERCTIRKTRSSSAIHRCMARRKVRPTSTGWRGSGLLCETAGTGGRRRHGRSRLRIHDRWCGGGARSNRSQFCGRHGRHCLRAGRCREIPERCNTGMVELEPVSTKEDKQQLHDLITKHFMYTGSRKGKTGARCIRCHAAEIREDHAGRL